MRVLGIPSADNKTILALRTKPTGMDSDRVKAVSWVRSSEERTIGCTGRPFFMDVLLPICDIHDKKQRDDIQVIYVTLH